MRFQQPLDDETDTPFTEIELPWQLFVSPDGATPTHSTVETSQGAAVVPLWRSRLAPGSGSGTGALRILRADGGDPFELPLGSGARDALAAAPSPAVVERLEVARSVPR